MRFGIGKHFAFLTLLFLAGATVSAEALNLDQCIELALKNRANIIIARGRAKVASADKMRSFGQFLPNIDASYSRSEGEEYDINPPLSGGIDKQDKGPNKNLSVSASMDVINFSNWFNFFGASASSAAAYLAAINSEQELIFDVKSAYYGYLRAVQNEETNKQAVERSKEQLKLVESRYELGSAAYSDVLGQRVLYGNDRLEHLRAQNNVTTTKAVLSYTIGTDPNQNIEFETVADAREFVGSMEEAINFGLEHEPGLLAAQKELSAGKHGLSSALADYFPKLSIFGEYSDFTGNVAFPTVQQFSSKEKTFGFRISYSIFDGFGRQRNVTQAKVNRNNAIADHSDARNLVMQQIKTAYLDIQNQKQAVSVAQESVAAAEENMKIVQERYNLGAATILDLLTAQEDLKRAQVSYINSRFDLNLAIARLENAMGKP